MDLIQIILYATIAAFFGLRLYMLLGRRTGDEQRETPHPAPSSEPATEHSGPALNAAFTGPAAAGMEAIRAADGHFDPQDFITGARAAYELIVTAFADGDRESLANLLTPSVLERYVAAIEAREAAGRNQVSDIVSIDAAEIEAAELAGHAARVAVRFSVELASGVTDGEGAVVEGDPSYIHKVVELWTFERDANASDPNWRLAKVRQG